ncbi:MAG: hypothetical protein KJ058_07545 [Thermoanaerobaculia bacterium]|nr:hypothetical protein [Thermoanaerobaculia bacterium]
MTLTRPADPTRLLVGILFIAGGVLLLARALELVAFLPSIWKLWPAVVIAVGIARLLWPTGQGGRLLGLWFVLLGSWGAVNVWGLFGLSWTDSWPLLVVGVGVILVLEALFEGRGKEADDVR